MISELYIGIKSAIIIRVNCFSNATRKNQNVIKTVHSYYFLDTFIISDPHYLIIIFEAVLPWRRINSPFCGFNTRSPRML